MEVIKTIKDFCNYIIERLTTCGCEIAEPGGGFYVFPDFSNCEKIKKFSLQKMKWKQIE